MLYGHARGTVLAAASIDPDVLAYAADIRAQGGTISGARIRSLSLFVKLEKAAGIWPRQADYFPVRGENDIQRKTSLKLRLHMTDIGTPVLDPEIGTYFDGSSAMNTGFVPSARLASGSDLALRTQVAYDNANAGVTIGCMVSSTSNMELRPRSSGDLVGRLNSAAVTLAGAVADSRALIGISRNGSTATGWNTGVSLGTASPSTGTTLPNIPLYMGSRNNAGTRDVGFTGWISYADVGASLTAAQEAAHAANVAILFSLMDQEYLASPALSPLVFAALGENYAWLDFTDPSTLYTDEAMTTLVEHPGDPVRAVADKSGNGNHAKATSMVVPPRFWSDGLRFGVKMGGPETGGGLEIPSMDLSATDKVSGVVGFHRYDRETVLQVLSIGGPVDSTPVDFDLSLRVGYGPPADPRSCNFESGPTASFKKEWASIPDEADMVWEWLYDRSANTALRKAIVRCNGLEPTDVDSTAVGVPTGNFSATSRVCVGVRPVTGGDYLSQELDAPIFHMVLGAGKQPRSILSAVRNYVMGEAISAVPGVASMLALTATHEGFGVSVKLTGATDLPVRVVASAAGDWSDAVYSEPLSIDEYNVATGEITGLEADTSYSWSVDFGGTLADGWTGSLLTCPEPGSPQSFGIIAGSCVDTNRDAYSMDRALDHVRAGRAHVIYMTGDLGYQNVGNSDPEDLTVDKFNEAFDYNLRAVSQTALYSSVQFVYMADDHDRNGGDNVDSATPGGPEFAAFFRGRLPYDFRDDEGAPDFKKVRGRTRTIIPDSRMTRSARLSTDDASKVCWDADTYAWVKAEMLAAKAAGQTIHLISTMVVMGPTTTDDLDIWGQYSTFRAGFVAWMTANDLLGRTFFLCGDAHFLAFDDGTSVNNPVGVPVVVSAPYFKDPNAPKGGPYLRGPFPASGGSDYVSQYSLIEVTDNGGSTISYRVRGYSVDTTTGVETALIDETFTRQADA